MGHGRQDQQWTSKEACRGRASEALAPTIAKIQNAGFVSLNAITRELSEREIPTPQGGKWHPTSVKRLLQGKTEGVLAHRGR